MGDLGLIGQPQRIKAIRHQVLIPVRPTVSEYMVKEIIQLKPNKVKNAVKSVLGEKGTTIVKRMINR